MDQTEDHRTALRRAQDRARDLARERYPFPPALERHLAEWHETAELIAVRNPSHPAREIFSGRGDPAGPREWDDTHGRGYKSFLVYFLPVGGALINHNLSVLWLAGPRTVIRAYGHGAAVEIARRNPGVADFVNDLHLAARMVGLLPGEVQV